MKNLINKLENDIRLRIRESKNLYVTMNVFYDFLEKISNIYYNEYKQHLIVMTDSYFNNLDYVSKGNGVYTLGIYSEQYNDILENVYNIIRDEIIKSCSNIDPVERTIAYTVFNDLLEGFPFRDIEMYAYEITECIPFISENDVKNNYHINDLIHHVMFLNNGC